MNQLIIFAAKYLFVISLAVAAVYWFRQDRATQKQMAVQLILSAIIAIVLAKIGGLLIQDPRPFVVGHFTPLIPHSNDNGFPSDHTLLTSLLGFALLPFSKRLGIALLIIALLVGTARVAAGIHHPLDIVGAFLITSASAGVAYWVRKRNRHDVA